jgi:hypothetical protein
MSLVELQYLLKGIFVVYHLHPPAQITHFHGYVVDGLLAVPGIILIQRFGIADS